MTRWALPLLLVLALAGCQRKPEDKFVGAWSGAYESAPDTKYELVLMNDGKATMTSEVDGKPQTLDAGWELNLDGTTITVRYQSEEEAAAGARPYYMVLNVKGDDTLVFDQGQGALTFARQ